jgi:hypothetical protein
MARGERSPTATATATVNCGPGDPGKAPAAVVELPGGRWAMLVVVVVVVVVV